MEEVLAWFYYKISLEFVIIMTDHLDTIVFMSGVEPGTSQIKAILHDNHYVLYYSWITFF
jgi:hypothetical protein